MPHRKHIHSAQSESLQDFQLNFGTRYQNKLIDFFKSNKFLMDNGIFYNSYTFFNKINKTSGSISTSNDLKIALNKTTLLKFCPVLKTLEKSPTSSIFSHRIEIQDELSDHLIQVRRNAGFKNSRVKILSCEDYSFCIGITHEDEKFNIVEFIRKNSKKLFLYEAQSMNLLSHWIQSVLPEIYSKPSHPINNPLRYQLSYKDKKIK